MAESNTRSDDGKPAWWHMLDRAYKMMEMAGYRVAEHNPDHNNPIVAWMADARVMLHRFRHDDVDKMADGLRVLADLPCPPDERELLLSAADALTARSEHVPVPRSTLERWNAALEIRNKGVVNPPLLTDGIQNEIATLLAGAATISERRA